LRTTEESFEDSRVDLWREQRRTLRTTNEIFSCGLLSKPRGEKFSTIIEK
jgi:hypothetical protein